jgi:hypothetical protein
MGALGALGLDENTYAGALSDPRMNRVLNSSVESFDPSGDAKAQDAADAYSAGAVSMPNANAGTAVVKGFGAQLEQRNKQKELQAQYLPTITGALLQQQQMKMEAAKIAFLSDQVNRANGVAGPIGAGGASVIPAGAGAPGYVQAGGKTIPLAGATRPGSGGGASIFTGANNPLGIPPELQMKMMLDPTNPVYQAQMKMYEPTDATKTANQAGIDPQYANLMQFIKNTNIDPVSLRGSTYFYNGTIHPNPPQPAQGFELYKITDDAQGNIIWGVRPQVGGPESVQAHSGAQALGTAQGSIEPVWQKGPNGEYIRVPVSKAQVLGAATTPQQAIAGATAGNPNATPTAVTPQLMDALRFTENGKNNPYSVNKVTKAMGPYQFEPDTVAMLHQQGMKFNPFDENESRAASQAYLGDLVRQHGGDLTRALAAYGGGMVNGQITPNGMAYVQKVMGNMNRGAPPQQAAQAGPQGQPASVVPQSGPVGANGSGGPMLVEPPLGVTTNTNESNKVAPAAVKESWDKLQGVVSNASAVDEALARMQKYAKGRTEALGMWPMSEAAKKVNPDAEKYEKDRAFINTQLSAGSAGSGGSGTTDYAKEILGTSIPDWGIRKDAIQQGLQTLRNQLELKQLKSNYLLPHVNDANAYTAKQNAFDTAGSSGIGPDVAHDLRKIVSMPAGPGRAAAMKTAAQSNPKMKAALDWAYENGMMK